MSAVRLAREPFGTIADRVSRRDREFFDAHPDEESYIRRFCPGEISPDAARATGTAWPVPYRWVVVTQVAPGLRARRFVEEIAGRPRDGRLTLVWRDGTVTADAPIVGWGDGR